MCARLYARMHVYSPHKYPHNVCKHLTVKMNKNSTTLINFHKNNKPQAQQCAFNEKTARTFFPLSLQLNFRLDKTLFYSSIFSSSLHSFFFVLRSAATSCAGRFEACLNTLNDKMLTISRLLNDSSAAWGHRHLLKYSVVRFICILITIFGLWFFLLESALQIIGDWNIEEKKWLSSRQI